MAKVYVVKNRRSKLGVVIGAAVVVALMALTNPTLADLESHVRSRASADARRQSGGGLLGDLASGIASGGAGFVARNLYVRRNFLIFSTFEPKSSRNPRYIGLFKGVFIKA